MSRAFGQIVGVGMFAAISLATVGRAAPGIDPGAAPIAAPSAPAPAAPTTAPDVAPASQPATPPTTQPITSLLKDLASDDWKLRQQAADALATVEPAQLPELRKAVDGVTDVDVRNSLLAAIKRIEDGQLTAPSLVTLHAKDAPAADVLRSLGKQLPYDLVCDNTDWLADTKVTVNADHQPFWAVMKLLSPQWPVRVMTAPNDPGHMSLLSTGSNYLTERSAVAGPFLVCPIMLQSNSALDLLQPVPQAKFRMVMLQMAVLSEPKLRATRVNVTVKDAIDENGKNIAATNMNGMNMMQSSATSQAATIMVRLTPAADSGKKITSLHGLIRCRVPTRTRQTEAPNFNDGKEHSVELGGRTVKVTLLPHDKQYDLKIAMPTNVNVQDETSISLLRDFRLLDVDGNALYRRTTNQTMNGQNWEFLINFSREGTAFGKDTKMAGEPVKLVWDLPVESKDMESPFELTNIPLTQ